MPATILHTFPVIDDVRHDLMERFLVSIGHTVSSSVEFMSGNAHAS